MIDLDEIERITKAATEGEWFYDSYSKVLQALMDDNEDNYLVAQVEVCSGDTATKQGAANAEFIARSRAWVPELVAEVRRLRAKLEAIGVRAVLEAVTRARYPP